MSMSQRHTRQCAGFQRQSRALQRQLCALQRQFHFLYTSICGVTQRRCSLPQASIQFQLQLYLRRQCATLRRCCFAQGHSAWFLGHHCLCHQYHLSRTATNYPASGTGILVSHLSHSRPLKSHVKLSIVEPHGHTRPPLLELFHWALCLDLMTTTKGYHMNYVETIYAALHQSDVWCCWDQFNYPEGLFSRFIQLPHCSNASLMLGNRLKSGPAVLEKLHNCVRRSASMHSHPASVCIDVDWRFQRWTSKWICQQTLIHP